MTDDSTKPSAARMYDYFIGGTHNFEVDRAAAERIIAMYPQAKAAALANRAFLRRVVTFLAQQGVTQFIDIGSGIPSVGNVHEIARKVQPGARAVYVDIDPIAVAYGQELIADSGLPSVAVIAGDVRRPDEILHHAEVRHLIDFRQPVAVLMVALLHFVTNDGEAQRVVQAIADELAPGSYIVISHVTDAYLSPEVREQSQAVYARSANPSVLRSHKGITALFGDLDLLDPGLVLVPLWRPDRPDDSLSDNPEQSMFLGAVGMKR